MEYTLNINEKTYKVQAQEDETLLNVLRDTLHLTGTKRGCDIGACGTCTVIINGQAKRSCVVKMAQLGEGDKIETIEGLEKDGKLHPLQESFMKFGAIQCGFCTPGMIMSAKALLDSNPNPKSPGWKFVPLHRLQTDHRRNQRYPPFVKGLTAILIIVKLLSYNIVCTS
jgi:carbon-monoxide dehydrogenase small subunit